MSGLPSTQKSEVIKTSGRVFDILRTRNLHGQRTGHGDPRPNRRHCGPRGPRMLPLQILRQPRQILRNHPNKAPTRGINVRDQKERDGHKKR
jgi:hypothetical protein